MINDETEAMTLRRLRRIEGQIAGIKRMIGDRRYCIDIVMQIAAAEAALHRVAEIVLRNHIETCVINTFRSSDERETRAKIDELMRVYGNLRTR